MTNKDVAFEFDPYAPAVQADPYPFYREMRDRFPLYWSEKGNYWVLSRYDDVVEAKRMHSPTFRGYTRPPVRPNAAGRPATPDRSGLPGKVLASAG